MASTIPLRPPQPFDFKKPDEWTRWKRRFQQFLSASGLDKEEELRQISTLLYCLGDEAEGVLASTNISDDARKSYKDVMAKLDEHFKVRNNTIYERARFNRRDQQEGESAEEYVTALYELIETCEYGELHDEMLRDRLVVGIRDAAMSEKLQLDPELTLEKAKKAIRQKEAVREQSKRLTSQKVHLVENVTPRAPRRPQRTGGGAPPQPRSSTAPAKCLRCGRRKHQGSERCPAKNVICHKCQKKGHFKAYCLSKPSTVSTVAAESQEEEEAAFLGTVTSQESSTWKTMLKLNGKEVSFKLDTGAEVTAISEETYRQVYGKTLQRASKVLYGPACQSLKVIGQFRGQLSGKQQSHEETIFVIRGLKNNLLGLPALTSLQIVQRVDTTYTSVADATKDFPKVFSGLGNFGEPYTIQLKEDAKPYALFTPRNVPLPLRKKVGEELNRMESLGVISKVNEPTPWCAGLVVVPKKSGDVRLCVDLKVLNESVLRETHPIPKVEDSLAQLSGATLFTKLDANSGFWQIPLSESSRLLTTFITPFGRYAFNKLPFGISSAPELFQKRINLILEGLEGVVCQIDDILVFGKDQEEHQRRLAKVLERLESANVTLNSNKCEFNKTSVKFLGYVIDHNGVRPDPDKTEAICRMEPPKSVSDLRRFLGMVNQMGRFSPNIAELTQPMRELLSTKRTWLWGPEQDKSFTKVKEELSKSPSLALYDPEAEVKISADASSFGLGAVLLQKVEGGWKPVAYASRSMSPTERRYAQIEKEALAITWACGKFSNYVLGKEFTIESDHKPLIPLLNSKHLDILPPRIVRFRLRLAKFSYKVYHVPGKLLYTADALSRAPVPEVGEGSLQEEVEAFVEGVTRKSLPATPERLEEYRKAQEVDPICSQLREYCSSEWPPEKFIPQEIKPYYKFKESLTLGSNLLLYNSRIVVPKSLRRETLNRIHSGHQGIERCRTRVTTSVWWPGVVNEIAQMVQNCHMCAKEAEKRREPLISTPLPDYPWQMVGTDLFELNKTQYLLVVDYFSRYPEVIRLTSTSSVSVIVALKSIFARHGIPEIIRSDNGPQYSSREFAEFATSYGFRHTTSSPRYPQSNGQVERMVQTIKRMIKRSEDPHLAVLSYRATPHTWCGFSPAELCMGRRIRTTVPQTNSMLVPKWSYLNVFKQKNAHFKTMQKKQFDRRHRVKESSPIPDDADVWITSESVPVPGRVVSPGETPRSYVVETPSGQLQRNRSQLNVAPNETSSTELQTPQSSPPRRIVTRTVTGTEIKPPDRWA